MVYRIFVEKRKGLANEANALKNDIINTLGIKLDSLRILNRYDVENIEKDLFDYSVKTVFSEPQLDIVTDELNKNEGDIVFAVEYLPGQFDQRADSAAQCIQIISQKDKPLVKNARVYVLTGNISENDVNQIKKYVINPVEAREASLERYDTLKTNYDIPTTVETLDGFISFDNEKLNEFVKKYGLAMDFDDLKFCQDYFKSENRNPTITEIRMIDTYWSDHCRHTTFLTTIDSVEFEDELLQKAYDDYISVRKAINRTKPVNLMDLATVATRYLKSEGKLPLLDESEEINACTVKMKIKVDGVWKTAFQSEGFVEVRPDEVLVFSQLCEWDKEIDLVHVQKLKAALEEEARSEQSISEQRHTAISLARTITRLKVGLNSKTKL